jgi:DnaJ-class molecular chaperone
MFNANGSFPLIDAITSLVRCPECDGSGMVTIFNAYDPEYKEIEICSECRGTGFVNATNIHGPN